MALMTNSTPAAPTILSYVLAWARDLAGDDFRWDSPDAPRTLDSRHRRGLSILLAAAQNGLCVACGDALAGEPVNLCHVVASRVSGRGIMAGNVYMGHVGCNDDDSKVYGDVVPVDSLIRADLIPMAFPSRQECHAAAAGADATRAERRARRADHAQRANV